MSNMAEFLVQFPNKKAVLTEYCFRARATGGIRTHDLTITNRLLCQLSYGGKFSAGGIIQENA